MPCLRGCARGEEAIRQDLTQCPPVAWQQHWGTLSKGRQKRLVAARSLLCYFAVHALGIPAVELAKRLTMTPSAISYAVVRGKEIAERNHYAVLSEDN